MTYLASNAKSVPVGARKLLYLNWPLVLLLGAICAIGILMLYSVAGGSMSPWAEPQAQRFAMGLSLMFVVGDGADLVLAQHGGLSPIWPRCCCWWRWSCSAASAWVRSVGSTSASSGCSRPS